MVDSFIAVDIETTGLSPEQDKIIEIGAIKIVKGKVESWFSELINPNIKLSQKIIELTSINDDMLKEAKQETEVLQDFYEFAQEDILLGHNILFDYSFLKVGMHRLNLPFLKKGLDTLRLSRLLHKELPSRKLTDMCEYYGIENLHAHRAMEDADAAKNLYFKLGELFYSSHKEAFEPFEMQYKVKKVEPITLRQKKYLLDLMKYHKIEWQQLKQTPEETIETLTKREASKRIDAFILKYGRMR